MNYPVAEENLKLAKRILDVLNVPFWLTCGTLLGVIRDNDFISHDTDIDLGIFIKNWNPGIIKAFEGNGFELYHQFGTKEKGLEYSFVRRGVKVDLFFFYQDPESGFNWMSVYGGKGMKSMCKYNFPWLANFIEIEFKHEKFMVPSNYERYLAAQYGEDWQKRLHGFQFRSS